MAVATRSRPDLEPLAVNGGRLCALLAPIHATPAAAAPLAASFDADGGWGGAGIRSLPHWLSINAGLDLHTSADLLRIGHGLPGSPLIRQPSPPASSPSTRSEPCSASLPPPTRPSGSSSRSAPTPPSSSASAAS